MRFIASDKLMKRGKKREREDNSSTMAGIFYYQGPKEERASIFSGWGKNYPENPSKIYNYHVTSYHVNNVIKIGIILSFYRDCIEEEFFRGEI